MAEEKIEENEEAMAIRRRCPLDATILVLTEIDGLTGLYCSECEYFEPVL